MSDDPMAAYLADFAKELGRLGARRRRLLAEVKDRLRGAAARTSTTAPPLTRPLADRCTVPNAQSRHRPLGGGLAAASLHGDVWRWGGEAGARPAR